MKEKQNDFLCEVMQEHEFSLDNAFAKGKIVELQLNGFMVCYREVEISRLHKVDIETPFPFYKLLFEFGESDTEVTTFELGDKLSLSKGNYNLLYLPKNDHIFNFGLGKRKTLEISFTHHFLNTVAGIKLEDFFSKPLPDAVASRVLWDSNKKITKDIEEYLTKFCNCSLSGLAKKAYLESLIMEFVQHIFSKNSLDKNTELQSGINNEVFQNLEVYIKSNYRSNLTIAELAQLTGMNTSKFKIEFKKEFKTTVFKYITGIRMDKAKFFLTTQQHTIAQIAYEVGYKNPQHFTVAFKKYFGVLPSSLLKEQV